MRAHRIAAVAVALLVMSAATAAASPQYPGQQPLPPMLDQLAGQADAFWIAHDRADVCPAGVRTWQAPSLLDGDGIDASGRGWHDGDDCQFWIKGAVVAQALEPVWWKDLAVVCFDVVHEDGHARGRGHTARGVMAAATTSLDQLVSWTPPFCIVWAKKTMREVLRGEGEGEREIARQLR